MIKPTTLWFFPIFLLLLAGVFMLPGVFARDGIVEVDRFIDEPVFDQFEKENLLVFFGYVGCRDICTPRLEEMAALYDSLTPEQQAGTGVLFINIKPHVDQEQSRLFSRSFHPAFQGVSLEEKTLQRIMRTFSARYSPSLGKAGEFDHTGFLYILKKRGTKYHINALVTLVPFNRGAIVKYLYSGKRGS